MFLESPFLARICANASLVTANRKLSIVNNLVLSNTVKLSIQTKHKG